MTPEQTQKNNLSHPGKITGNRLLYILFSFLLLLCYHNSFHASWHFDDIANIVLNTPLHIDNLTPESVKQTFFAYPDKTGKFLRPISNLTFGINWFLGQDKVFGYHLVNFLIHLLTSLFLYHTCLLLLSTPKIANKYNNSKFFIAALAAILWAIHPIQTQAITYIVQRMASLAALFSLVGIWCYLKARLHPLSNKKTFIFYLGTVLAFLLAIGSKENAVILPASILLIEFIFFQQSLRVNRKNVFFLIAGFILILTFTLLLVGPGFFYRVFTVYETRDFTLWQRLLTEARIVVFYLSLLLFPSPFRLSITHDVLLSSSLFSPLTTLPAILSLAILTILPLIYYKKFPLLSFAFLFFLLNHIVESTIIPLELTFEHRNYLPSFFLFLPLAAIVNTAIQNQHTHNRIVPLLISISTIILLILLTMWTITRNSVWLTEKSLWLDSLAKSPESARSYINLAHSYQYRDKNFQKAFELNHLSLDKVSPTPWKDRLRAYNNMGNIMSSIGNYEQAIIFYDKALSFSKEQKKSLFNSGVIFQKSKVQWLMGQKNLAISSMAMLVADQPKKGLYLQVYGEMLVSIDRWPEGIDVLTQALANSQNRSKEYWMALLDLSLVYSKMGDNSKATLFINTAKRYNADIIQTNLCLLEHSLQIQDLSMAEETLTILLSKLTWPGLITILDKTALERPTLPLNYSQLLKYTSEWLTIQKTP